MNIATHLAAHPGGTLPQAFPDWAELKAASRCFEQEQVTFERVLTPHEERTRLAGRTPGEHLLIEDTTLLDYSRHRATRGLGVIGNGDGRGFERHSALAVRVEGWTPEQRPEGLVVGLFGQPCRRPQPAPPDETNRPRLGRPRQSQTGAAVLEPGGRPPAGSRWIYIADRESDFYEPLRRCREQGVDFVVRAGPDRRLAEGAGPLRETLARVAALGRATVALRARPGQAARTATVALRCVRLDLDGPWRPEGWQEPLRDVGVVEVREVDASAGAEPLPWILLTTLPCATLAEARRVVGRSGARWWIEEYHKALKTGAGVEESQMEAADKLEPLIGVLAVVAVRLLSTKFLARSRPESGEAAESFGPELLRILEKKAGRPAGGWTNRNLLVAVARLGGFLARKQDGMPGWQTIWRGWQRLLWLGEGASLINA